MDPLSFLARHGPWVLVGGLLVGLAIPPEVNVLRDYIREMVVVLLFLSVLRSDLRALVGRSRDLPKLVGAVLSLQLLVPLIALALGATFGLSHSPVLLAVTLVAAAPAIVGSPNICAMIGVEPVQSLRLLIVGTALLPLTIIPVFWASAQLGGVRDVLSASLILLLTLGLTIVAATGARHWLLPSQSQRARQRMDGLSSLALALFVVGLMPAIRATALSDPGRVVFWMGLAFAVNWGAQVLTYEFRLHRSGRDTATALAIYAGNRNIALFLVALPTDVTAEIMVFVGCYQFPMYLTPLFMNWYTRRRAAPQ